MLGKENGCGKGWPSLLGSFFPLQMLAFHLWKNLPSKFTGFPPFGRDIIETEVL
jgi:hypothetical protein